MEQAGGKGLEAAVGEAAVSYTQGHPNACGQPVCMLT